MPGGAKTRFTYYPVSGCRYLISLLSEFAAEAVLDGLVLWVSDTCQILKRHRAQGKRNWSLDCLSECLLQTEAYRTI